MKAIIKRTKNKLAHTAKQFVGGGNKQEKIKKNVFNKANKKRVLISFLISPFTAKLTYTHTNQNECIIAAKIFDELGFMVDVVNYDNTSLDIDYSIYDVVYGFGNPVENYFLHSKINKTGPKVFLYLNGSYTVYSNLNGAKRVMEFYQKTGLFYPNAARIVASNWTWSHHIADLLIVLGNKTVVDTYSQLEHHNIKNLNAFFYRNNAIDISKKDFDKAKNNYLWFGNSGSIHKGLDVVLDYFSKNHECTLHVCGVDEAETTTIFKTAFAKSNIVNHGRVDVMGQEFANIMMKCGFCVYPSVSEGGAVSVLTCMGNGGLYPIITKSTGLDCFENVIEMSSVSMDELALAIDKSKGFSSNDLKNQALEIFNKTNELYTLDNFCLNLKQILQASL